METPSLIPLDILTDMDAVVRFTMTGKADLATLSRIAERGSRVRQEILQDQGVLDIGLQLLREIREEE